MELREKVARSIAMALNGGDHNWQGALVEADAAIAAMPQAPADDEARWVVEQAVRLMAGGSLSMPDGRRITFTFAVDAVRNELDRVRTDLEAIP